ncbi:desiccation-related protein PCC13-62 [Amborella trichopoda]|nr:desiccation-related protein PCC13-62 [Amborella trichopoda]|eukprot:XP_006838114.2 desiccation-related protein PCC13-62 [Amborella trichopoda]
MAMPSYFSLSIILLFLSHQALAETYSCPHNENLLQGDVDLLEFPLNLEYTEAEFFLYGAVGYGLDEYDPKLAMGGPPPIGVRKANLDPFTRDLITQFAYQEVGHIRAIKSTVRGFPRPLLDLSPNNFAKLFDMAFEHPLSPPFDPYINSLNYILAVYVIPYVGLTGYVGANPNLQAYASKKLVAGLLAVESGQDAVIRALLYERAEDMVKPYEYTVAEFTDRISELRNRLGHAGIKDEGLVVPPELGAENKTSGNILSADYNSLAYGRTPAEVLRIVYSTGDEHKPGGFFPNGGKGTIAESYLKD